MVVPILVLARPAPEPLVAEGERGRLPLLQKAPVLVHSGTSIKRTNPRSLWSTTRAASRLAAAGEQGSIRGEEVVEGEARTMPSVEVVLLEAGEAPLVTVVEEVQQSGEAGVIGRG